jgi:arylsulfatase A-like enzyme
MLARCHSKHCRSYVGSNEGSWIGRADSLPAQTGIGSSPLPDVYLVTIDTLRADHVHCYGDDRIQTPALDSLARDGIRFAWAFTPSPITNTSHTSILTGLLPSVHGVTDFAIPLAKTYPNLGRVAQAKRISNGGLHRCGVLDSRTLAPGLDRGFDYYDNFPSDSAQGKHWGRIGASWRRCSPSRRNMDGRAPRKPRFVWVHLYDPHDPYEPPPPYSQIYKDRLYDGEIAYADAALGILLAYLKRETGIKTR